MQLQIVLEIRKKCRILESVLQYWIASIFYLYTYKKFASLYLSLNSVVVIALAFHLWGSGSNPGWGKINSITFSPIQAFATKPLLNSLSILAPQNKFG